MELIKVRAIPVQLISITNFKYKLKGGGGAGQQIIPNNTVLV